LRPRAASLYNRCQEPLAKPIAIGAVDGEAAVMHLSHLGLPVRDERRSQQFYSAYFGFDPATTQEYEDGTIIIRDADGFDLAAPGRADRAVAGLPARRLPGDRAG
jgi:catechol 2,3-dioxygenase-like lactoylglutathione lyase family enzyme